MLMFPDPSPAKERTQPIPQSIRKALLAGVKKGATLAVLKDQHNDHGDYEYASVDAVYATAQGILAEIGLGVLLTEKDVRYDADNKRIRFVFQVTLFTEDDEWTSEEMLRTIILPYTGPQTCQAAQSYVEKALFKHLFKLKTGDKEPEDAGMPGVNLKAAEKKAAKDKEPKRDPMSMKALVDKIKADLDKTFPEPKKMTPTEMEDFAVKWGADISTLDEANKTTVRNWLKERKA